MNPRDDSPGSGWKAEGQSLSDLVRMRNEVARALDRTARQLDLIEDAIVAARAKGRGLATAGHPPPTAWATARP